MLPQAAIDIVNRHVFFRPNKGEGWQSKPELPTSQEIMAEKNNLERLPTNPVDVPWSSKNEYLTAQYEILRHEATDGLRSSVRSFVHSGEERPMDDDSTNIYTQVRLDPPFEKAILLTSGQVRIKQYVMSGIGPLARVSFSTERSNFRIQWLQSKRLQPGKIVALSPKSDGFKTICKIASVAQRPYLDGLDQDPPLVDLLWANPEDAVFDPTLEMVMIESLNGYFESARHALVGLQHVARTR
jgi:helicase required for RNAi-mediated heterochromatin assembly 1